VNIKLNTFNKEKINKN